MNATSSRSHAIFTLQLSQKSIERDELVEGVTVTNDEFITSKFHFVDLGQQHSLTHCSTAQPSTVWRRDTFGAANPSPHGCFALFCSCLCPLCLPQLVASD